jgi:large conductance mechanosensitive channel
MGMLQEFKKFALRGNVIDLAIGVIIGAAFGKIVTSMVDDVMMPPIGVLMSVSRAQDFQDWALPLNPDNEEEFKEARSAEWAKAHGVATINYGRFVNNVLSFLIVAFCVFLVVKQVNRFMPPPPAQTRECPQCRTMISNKATRCPNCTSEIAPTAA